MTTKRQQRSFYSLPLGAVLWLTIQLDRAMDMQIMVTPALTDMQKREVRYMAYKKGPGAAMLVSFYLIGKEIKMLSEVWGVAPGESVDAEVSGT